ncbi:MAG: PEP-CTERM sorting domain-containing protein [Planctomycetaceae bacterium]|nr:PEP-CTERM sorting domain-containing protein [Planctomycetaceae bacterium]
MKKQTFSVLTPAFLALVFGFGQMSVQAGTEIIIDFDDIGNEWLDEIEFYGTSELRDEGGLDDSGYLSVTDASNGQRGAIEFPDVLEGGSYDGAVKIQADLRVGGGTARPADGFSFNLVRPDDDLLGTGEGYASSQAGEGNLPEEGSMTGLAIGFDEWQSGEADPDATDEDCGDPELYDCVGISVRVDDEVVAQTPFPFLNGEVDDLDSLQTGPDATDPEDLEWAPFMIELSPENNLLIEYKGREVFNEVIDYERGPGQLFFGGRTGGANSNHHIDNIYISVGAEETVPGDYNQNGLRDAGDLDLNASVGIAAQDLAYDLNEDGVVNTADRIIWVNDLKNTWMGDADLNGQFDSGDLVTVFAAAKYETGQEASWGQGDWNGDQKFDSGDLVTAFSNAGYEAGERPGGPNAAAVVPEPSTMALALISLLGLMGVARRRNS